MSIYSPIVKKITNGKAGIVCRWHKLKMQNAKLIRFRVNAKCKMQNAECKIEVRMVCIGTHRRGDTLTRKCKMQNAECKIEVRMVCIGTHRRGDTLTRK